ncbi:adenylate/guanylate cyclase domain-containing protein [Polaromonas sp.]|uniref:adenylate/guanylate cyclase domain-containing protein n=1 Tax=Polaromonas sp. TaxID=1869339 RepID=UPI002FC92B0D
MNRNTKVLLVMDVVESVRLMEQDQDDFVRRWQQLVQQAEQHILPLHGGRIVKSLGDGLMLEFASAQGGMKAAFALQYFRVQDNAGRPSERGLHLRMGSHLAEFVSDKHDIYGTDVNLTARVATLAGPGEIVITAELRDNLTDGLEADIEDLGECYLKHVAKPIRAYRVGPPGHAPVIQSPTAAVPDFRPTIAIIPFEARSNEPEHFIIGEVVADGIIAQLSRSSDLKVISRLSTTAFRGRSDVMAEAGDRLAARFILSGSYIASGGKILIIAELADSRTNQIIWADRISGDTMDLLETQSELLDRIASAATHALIDSEAQQSLIHPLPRLDSCSLMLGGISHMHRSSMHDFDRSRQVLEAVLERHNRAAAPRAWLAKWYILRVVRGMSDAPQKDSRQAIEHAERALDLEPNSALALAIQGHALCQLSGDASGSLHKIEEAIRLNPSESLAWLYKSVWSSMWGESAASVEEASIASSLSPLDPMKYYYDMILAAGYSFNRDYEKAIAFARRSLKANKHHQPTLRALLLAQGESNQIEDARQTLSQLLQETPNLTIARYLAMGGASSSARQRVAQVLRNLGVPES